MKCWELQSDLAPSPLALRTLSPALQIAVQNYFPELLYKLVYNVTVETALNVTIQIDVQNECTNCCTKLL